MNESGETVDNVPEYLLPSRRYWGIKERVYHYCLMQSDHRPEKEYTPTRPLGTITQGPKSNGSYGLCPTALYKHRRGTRETKAGVSSGEWGCRGWHRTDGRDPIEWQAERFRDKEQEIERQGRTERVLPTGETRALQSRYLAALTRPVDIGKVALEQCWC